MKILLDGKNKTITFSENVKFGKLHDIMRYVLPECEIRDEFMIKFEDVKGNPTIELKLPIQPYTDITTEHVWFEIKSFKNIRAFSEYDNTINNVYLKEEKYIINLEL